MLQAGMSAEIAALKTHALPLSCRIEWCRFKFRIWRSIELFVHTRIPTLTNTVPNGLKNQFMGAGPQSKRVSRDGGGSRADPGDWIGHSPGSIGGPDG
jgi:hypothetical protein